MVMAITILFGTVASEFGGGAFSVGDKVYADTDVQDSFDIDLNETGSQGYYLIDSVANTIGQSASSILIEDYFDSETSQLVSVHSATAGTKGLGSEQGYLTSLKTQEKDFISNYNEADLNIYSTLSGRYFYGNGDYYTFSGTVASEFGGGAFSVGDKVYAASNDKDSFDRDLNETGSQGYYLIDSVVNNIGLSTSSILIEDYFDSETSQLVSVYSATAGTQKQGPNLLF